MKNDSIIKINYEWNVAQMNKLSGNEYKLLVYLQLRWNGEYRYAYPSYEAITSETGLPRKTISRCLTELENADLVKRGFVNKSGTKWRNNVYYINAPGMNASMWNKIKCKTDKTDVADDITDVTLDVMDDATEEQSAVPDADDTIETIEWKFVDVQPLPKQTEKPAKLNDMQKSEQNILQSAERVNPKVADKFVMATDDEIRQLVAEKNGAKLRDLQNKAQTEWMIRWDAEIRDYVNKLTEGLDAVRNGWLLDDEMKCDIPDDDLPF